MTVLRLPPRVKVLEALSAIGDKRVCTATERVGFVASSDRSRVYEVYVDLGAGVAYSSDNGTKLRGYIGYPIIAVLMATGRIPYKREYAEALAGIAWRMLNEKYRRYSIVERIVKKIAREKGVDPGKLDDYVEEVLKLLGGYRLERLDAPPLEIHVYRSKCSALRRSSGGGVLAV